MAIALVLSKYRALNKMFVYNRVNRHQLLVQNLLSI